MHIGWSCVSLGGKQGSRISTTTYRFSALYRLLVHINCFHNSDRAYVIRRMAVLPSPLGRISINDDP